MPNTQPETVDLFVSALVFAYRMLPRCGALDRFADPVTISLTPVTIGPPGAK